MFDTLCQIAFEELHKMITPVRPKDAQLTLPLLVLVYFQFLDIFVNLVEEKNLIFKIFICYWHQGWTFSHIFVYQEYFFMVLFLSSTIVLNIILFENPFVWAFFFLHRYFSSLCFIYYVFPAGYFSFDQLHIYEIKLSFYIVLGATLPQM